MDVVSNKVSTDPAQPGKKTVAPNEPPFCRKPQLPAFPVPELWFVQPSESLFCSALRLAASPGDNSIEICTLCDQKETQ